MIRPPFELCAAAYMGFLTLLLAAPEKCEADHFPVPAFAAEGLNENVVAQLQSQAQIHADDMYDFLLMKLDELDRVCHLSPKQQAKFKTAAKGAVDRAVTKWLDASVEVTKKSMAEVAAPQAAVNAQLQANVVAVQFGGGGFGGGGIGFGGGFVAAPAVPVRFVDEGFAPINHNVQVLLVNGQLGNNARQSAVFGAINIADVEQDNLWMAAERNLLSIEQSQARGEAIKARDALPYDWQPRNRMLTELDNTLLLDETQRDAFAEVVRPLIVSYLETTRVGQQPQMADVSRIVLKLRATKLKEILSERQLNYWKSTLNGTISNPPVQAGGEPSFDNLMDLIIETVQAPALDQ